MSRRPLLVSLCFLLAACQPPTSSGGGVASPQGAVPAKLLTDSEEDDIRSQIEANWNLPREEPCPPDKAAPFEMRIWVNSDGTVTRTEPIASGEMESCAHLFYESAHRAVLISSPLKLPPGKAFKTMRLRFFPNEVIE